jgi:hypothetical protein
MTNILTAVVSAADFERGCRVVSGLANYGSYDHWLDIRYGRVMGLSLGGAHASLESVELDDFLNWCCDCGIHPSETALDDFAQLSRTRPGPIETPEQTLDAPLSVFKSAAPAGEWAQANSW